MTFLLEFSCFLESIIFETLFCDLFEEFLLVVNDYFIAVVKRFSMASCCFLSDEFHNVGKIVCVFESQGLLESEFCWEKNFIKFVLVEGLFDDKGKDNTLKFFVDYFDSFGWIRLIKLGSVLSSFFRCERSLVLNNLVWEAIQSMVVIFLWFVHNVWK